MNGFLDLILRAAFIPAIIPKKLNKNQKQNFKTWS